MPPCQQPSVLLCYLNTHHRPLRQAQLCLQYGGGPQERTKSSGLFVVSVHPSLKFWLWGLSLLQRLCSLWVRKRMVRRKGEKRRGEARGGKNFQTTLLPPSQGPVPCHLSQTESRIGEVWSLFVQETNHTVLLAFTFLVNSSCLSLPKSAVDGDAKPGKA